MLECGSAGKLLPSSPGFYPRPMGGYQAWFPPEEEDFKFKAILEGNLGYTSLCLGKSTNKNWSRDDTIKVAIPGPVQQAKSR